MTDHNKRLMSEAASAERRYARHLDRYPAYKAHTLAMADFYDGLRSDRPEWTAACERDLQRKQAVDKANDDYHRRNPFPAHLDY
jgi:hypothetical protein